MLKRIAMVCSFSLALSACATSPLGRAQLALLSDAEMDAMGVEAFSTLQRETPVETDAALNQYVRCVAAPIIQVAASIYPKEAGGQWEVVVFRDDEPNAFALPGRKIGVHTGLLKVAANQHQLATVIGHEVAHVLAKHSNERASQELAVQMGIEMVSAVAQPQSELGQVGMAVLGLGAQYGVLMPFSRKQESESDMFGLDLMAKAGFDPRESAALWVNMGKAGGGSPPEFLSTHPSHENRIRDLQNRVGQTLPYYQAMVQAGRAPNCR